MFGNKELKTLGFPTPVDIPEVSGCRQFSIPASSAWYAVIMGCLQLLTDERNWQQFDGGITPSDAAAQAQLIVDEAYESQCVTPDIVPAPFWDSATDADDELTPEDQIWYGEVIDPEAAPGELTFVENAGIWVLTGFIAYSGDIGAAIAFHTIAPAFVLAWRAGDVGEIFRIVVDAADFGTVDTTGHTGEVMRSYIYADRDLDGHDIMLIKVS